METISPSQSAQRWLRILTIVVIALNLAVTIGFKVHSGGFHEWALTPWALIPMLILCAAALVAGRRPASWIVFAGTILCLVLTTYVYWHGFVVDRHPGNGTLYLNVPFYQLLWALVLFGIAGVDRLRHMDEVGGSE